jgi:hypothetical protein
VTYPTPFIEGSSLVSLEMGMTCIKTGARVYFEDYGFIAPADIFKVGDCYIIRWNVEGKRFDAELSEATHQVDSFPYSDDWWHRDDMGVTVIPSWALTEF